MAEAGLQAIHKENSAKPIFPQLLALHAGRSGELEARQLCLLRNLLPTTPHRFSSSLLTSHTSHLAAVRGATTLH